MRKQGNKTQFICFKIIFSQILNRKTLKVKFMNLRNKPNIAFFKKLNILYAMQEILKILKTDFCGDFFNI